MNRIEIFAGSSGYKKSFQAVAGKTITMCSRITRVSPISEAFPKIPYAEASEK